MKQANITEGPDYVIVKQLGNRDAVFDCLSSPQGAHDPVCVRVAFRTSALTADKRAERRAERMESSTEQLESTEP